MEQPQLRSASALYQLGYGADRKPLRQGRIDCLPWVVAAEFTCTDQFPNHDIGRGRPSWRDDHVDLPYSV